MKQGKIKRKRADIENKTFSTSSIDNAHGMPQQDRCVTRVKIPYFFRVSIRENIGVDQDPKNPIMATREEISQEPFPKEWDVESSTKATIQFTNKCPVCLTTGSPRIDEKNMTDYHYRPTTNTKKNPSKQEKQYRLIYHHKQEDGKIKQCVASKFDQYGIFTKSGKVSKDIEDYTFPNYIIKNI